MRGQSQIIRFTSMGVLGLCSLFALVSCGGLSSRPTVHVQPKEGSSVARRTQVSTSSKGQADSVNSGINGEGAAGSPQSISNGSGTSSVPTAAISSDPLREFVQETTEEATSAVERRRMVESDNVASPIEVEVSQEAEVGVNSVSFAPKFPVSPPASLEATCQLATAGPLTITLSNDSETADGTAGPDRIQSNSGNDTVRGLDGDDFINGNAGNDVLNGNSGNDNVRGGQDDDTVMGGQGDDCVTGDLGNDVVEGNLGNDKVIGGDGNDLLRGSGATGAACSDSSFSSCALDWLEGGIGDDTYEVKEGDGRIVILPDVSGNNRLICSPSGNLIETREGSDLYLKGSGFLIKIVGGNVSGSTMIDRSMCK